MKIHNETTLEMYDIPKEWVYRGEGNCNIAISLPKQRQILRIRKIEKPTSIFGWLLVLITDLLHWCYGKGYKDESRDLDFYLCVMRPLIGNKFTSNSKQVILTRKHVYIIKDELSKLRPASRQNKTLQYGRAALFDDFSYLPSKYDNLRFSKDTFCVEIKPKQGWRPIKEQILPQCFFCMNQFLKLEKKQIKTVTKYCPEELFSGDELRMKTTLRHLFEVPQNNFKIFKNGVLCYEEKDRNTAVLKQLFESADSEEKLIDELCDFLCKCLIANFDNKTPYHCSDCIKLKQQNLPVGSVLERILSVQMLDNDGSHSTYKKLTKCDSWESWSFVEKTLEIVKSGHNNCVKCSIIKASETYEDELMFVPYLISAIAKDCSLMITFRKLMEVPGNDQQLNNVFQTNYGNFLVNIGVFDLYPKPLSTIQKHYKRNKDIFKAFKKGK